MIDQKDLEAWLTSINEKYRQEEIPHRNRPWSALSDFSQEFNCSFTLDSPIAKSIFDWFAANSKPGSQEIGSLFTGAFYFDTNFWPLEILLGYGSYSLSPFDSLNAMPQAIKKQVIDNNYHSWCLNLYWIDCLDYAYGIDDIEKLGSLNPNALKLLQNGNRELVGAIAQLLIPHPNTKAILALRMASEIFMKALLVQEKNLTDQQLKKSFSHKIEDIANECFSATGLHEFEDISKNVSIFPDVSDRYHGNEWQLSDVWRALCITQMAGTAVTRRYSNRDTRPQLFHGQ